MKQFDALESVEWGMKHFGSILTGGRLRRRDMLREQRAGMVMSAGMVVVTDDDGFTGDPERYREGWVLTEAGTTQLSTLRKATK